jgi:hypothetical protein
MSSSRQPILCVSLHCGGLAKQELCHLLTLGLITRSVILRSQLLSSHCLSLVDCVNMVFNWQVQLIKCRLPWLTWRVGSWPAFSWYCWELQSVSWLVSSFRPPGLASWMPCIISHPRSRLDSLGLFFIIISNSAKNELEGRSIFRIHIFKLQLC